MWSWRSGLYRLRGDAEAIDEALADLVLDPSTDERVRRVSQRVLRHLLDELGGGHDVLRLAVLQRLGDIDTSFGEYDAAERSYRQALAVATDLSDRRGEASSLLA